jgi:hypothetical protein
MSRLTATKAAKNTAVEAKHVKDYVVPHLATARDAVVPVLGHAREAVAPVLGQARDAAAPHLAVARDRAVTPVLHAFKDDVLPRVSAGVSAGLAASEPVRAEAMRRGSASIAALRGIEPPKQHKGRRRLGKVMIVVALGAAASAAWKAWKLPHGSDDWVHTDAAPGGDIPATPTNPADALAEELRARNGQVPDPVAR